MKTKKILVALVCSAVAIVTPQILFPQSSATKATALKLPPLKKQITPDAVVDEHLDAINKCDWGRIMAQYPADAQFFLPLGQTVEGREKVGALFAAIVKPPDQGGICGAKLTREHTFIVGSTVNVQWVATADFLAQPYRGSDAYITRNGLMAATVTTFQGAQLEHKVAAQTK
jgi:hypothetical protein